MGRPDDGPAAGPGRAGGTAGSAERADEVRRLAVVELLGALAYAQLRAFEVTTRAVRAAPDMRTADRVAAQAVREHVAYATLRDHLELLTDLPGPVMTRQQPRIDEFFDEAPVEESWVHACTFFAVGLPLASDFVEAVGPYLDEDTAAVAMGALTHRGEFATFALRQLQELIEQDDGRTDQVRRLVADLTGRALTQFQGAIGDTDALEVLLTSGEPGEEAVRRMAITVLEAHRRRMHALGIEDLE